MKKLQSRSACCLRASRHTTHTSRHTHINSILIFRRISFMSRQPTRHFLSSRLRQRALPLSVNLPQLSTEPFLQLHQHTALHPSLSTQPLPPPSTHSINQHQQQTMLQSSNNGLHLSLGDAQSIKIQFSSALISPNN